MTTTTTTKDPHQQFRRALNKIDDTIILESGELNILRPRIPLEERGWKNPFPLNNNQQTDANGKPEPQCDLVLVIGIQRQLWRFHATMKSGQIQALVPPSIARTVSDIMSIHGIHVVN